MIDPELVDLPIVRASGDTWITAALAPPAI